MFRDMRRKNQLLPQEEAEAMLRQGTSGVLWGTAATPTACP